MSSESKVPFLSPGVEILTELPAIREGGGEAGGLGHGRRGGVSSGVCTVCLCFADITVRRWVLRVVRVAGPRGRCCRRLEVGKGMLSLLQMW